jgi:hypothetical protein
MPESHPPLPWVSSNFSCLWLFPLKIFGPAAGELPRCRGNPVSFEVTCLVGAVTTRLGRRCAAATESQSFAAAHARAVVECERTADHDRTVLPELDADSLGSLLFVFTHNYTS